MQTAGACELPAGRLRPNCSEHHSSELRNGSRGSDRSLPRAQLSFFLPAPFFFWNSILDATFLSCVTLTLTFFPASVCFLTSSSNLPMSNFVFPFVGYSVSSLTLTSISLSVSFSTTVIFFPSMSTFERRRAIHRRPPTRPRNPRDETDSEFEEEFSAAHGSLTSREQDERTPNRGPPASPFGKTSRAAHHQAGIALLLTPSSGVVGTPGFSK